MAIANVNITLGNGALNRTSSGADGVAGMILTGKAVSGKLELNRGYRLSSAADLVTLGITEAENPLAYKEIVAFYTQCGDGAELYVVIVAEATTLSDMVAITAEAPIHKLIAAGSGRIRLMGINKIAPDSYEPNPTQGIDPDAVSAAEAIQSAGESYFAKMRPFRCLVPACGWDGTTESLFKPRSGSYNRALFVLAADKKIGEVYSVSIGQVLGRAAAISVHQSVARVKDGAIAAEGWLPDGSTPDEAAGKWDLLDTAGYIFYRTFPGRNGVYLNDDAAAAPLSDDYANLRYGRVIDKAALIAYDTYLDEVQENIEIADDGTIPIGACRSYERALEKAILSQMKEEVSGVTVTIDPAQDVLSAEAVDVMFSITPKGVTKQINVKMGFANPANE